MKMKRVFIALFLACLCFACKQEDRNSLGGEGLLRLTAQVNDEVKVVSRAGEDGEGNGGGTSPEDELKQNCKIRIYKGDKLVYKHAGWDEAFDEKGLALSSGTYRVRITSGDSVAAAFDKKFYEGNEEFEITQHQTAVVEVVCNVGNTLAKVVFDASLKQYLTEGEVTVAVDDPDGTLTYPYTQDGEAAKTGYYSLPAGKEYLVCTFTGTTKSGKKFTQTDRVEEAKKSTLYTLTYTAGDGETLPPPTDEGGGFLDLKIVETPLEKREEEVTIYQRPQIRAVNGGDVIDMTQPWYLVAGSKITPTVFVGASSPLAKVMVTSDVFRLIDETLPAAPFDLMDETNRQLLENKGFSFTLSEAGDLLTMNWGNTLDKLLEVEKDYGITYEVEAEPVEMNGEMVTKTAMIEWHIVSSNLKPVNPPLYDVWADHAAVYGELISGEADESRFTFRYRAKGTETWSTDVEGVCTERSIKAEIKGLTPGTAYEYQVLKDGAASPVLGEFVTEAALQLPNSGFENWSGDSPKLVYGEGETMFWDSGNHGSATMGKNVTYPDESIKHSGTYAAKLESQYLAIQFAAGNLILGQYLKTEMEFITGHGILGLGRPLGTDASGNPITSRPLALKGYIKYVSGKVDKGGDQIKNDSQDIGIIYMALTDGEGEAYENSRWSFVIRTKDKHFFDKNAENVIAYGEKTWEQSTDGEGMVPFEIRFNYDEKPDGKTRIPNRIMIVAAASKFGDYFQGSTQSRMWLDDLELIYEESKLSKE